MLKKFKAVIFDMDGVIIDSEPLWKEAEIEVFKSVGLNLSEADCELTRGFRTDEVIRYWFSRDPWMGKSMEDVTTEMIEKVKELVKLKGKPFEGLNASIEHIKHQGLKIALCTSSHPILIKAVIEKFQLHDSFDQLVSAFDDHYGKPHPQVFLRTATLLDLEPSDCLVIEDSLSGLIASKAAKMYTIVMPDPSQKDWPQWSVADRKISSLKELTSII